MTEFVCQNNSSRTSSLYYGDRLSEKNFTGINISRQLVGENHSSGIESPDKATGCLEKLFWTNDWKTKKW